MAKDEGVSRATLELAEKLQKQAPELAEKVKAGNMTLDDAAIEAEIKTFAPKQPSKASKRKSADRPTGPKKILVDETLLDDALTAVVDRGDGVREIRTDTATILLHVDSLMELVIWKTPRGWRVLNSEEEEDGPTFDDRWDAEDAAETQMRKLSN